MRWALPNAHFYGLTGTPISGIDRNTFKLFGAEEDPGRYMSRYSYKQSIRDGATNPVKFEPRLAELRVDRDAINEEFEQLATENLSLIHIFEDGMGIARKVKWNAEEIKRDSLSDATRNTLGSTLTVFQVPDFADVYKRQVPGV